MLPRSWLISILFAVSGFPGAFADPDPGAHFGLVFGEAEVLQDLGADWSRSDFTWAGIERTQGTFDFRGLRERMDAFEAAGKHYLPILDYAPAWDPERAPADAATLDLWERYVQKTVGEFHGTLKYWQAWNEPNLSGFWKPAPDPVAYTALLRRTYEAAKRVNPQLQILGVNTSDIDLDYARRVFEAGGLQYCDIVAVQPYRIAPEVGHFEEVAALRALMRQFGGEKPIWFTEMGNDSRHFPFKDSQDYFAERPSRRQASFLVRYMTIILAAGIEKTFWFAQTAEGASLLDQNTGKKRAAYFAYQNFIRTVGAFQRVRALTPPGAHGLYAFQFTLPTETVVVAWSVRGLQYLYFPGRGGAVREVRDVLGQTWSGDKKSMLVVSSEPRFLCFDSADGLGSLSSVQFPEPQIFLEPGQEKKISFSMPDAVEPKPTDTGPQWAASLISIPGTTVPTHVSLMRSGTFTIKADDDAPPAHGELMVESGMQKWPLEINITPRALWSTQGPKAPMTPALIVGSSGAPLVLVPSFEESTLVALALDGQERWRYTTEGPINDRVEIADLDADGIPEIVGAVPGKHQIFALTADGQPFWITQTEDAAAMLHQVQDTGKPVDTLQNAAWRWTRPTVSDLNGDGKQEVVYADRSGGVIALDAAGKPLWSKQLNAGRSDQPVCIADVEGDSQPEVLAGTGEGLVFCLDVRGETVWKTQLEGAIESPLRVLDTNDAPPRILAATRNEEIVCLDSQGSIVWRTPVGGTLDLGAGIALGDIDGDGVAEIVVTTRNHQLLALNQAGKILWQFEAGAQFRTLPVLQDIDGDGASEILIAPSDWRLYCLDGKGTIQWLLNLGDRIDADPIVVRDSEKLLLITSTRNGRISCWRLS